MNIYTEERVGWMGSDVAKYRRKRAVSKDTMPGVGPRGIVHPALCFDNDPERLLIFHVREEEVQRHPRRALFKLAWIFFRDALRVRPGYARSTASEQAEQFRRRLDKIETKAGLKFNSPEFQGMSAIADEVLAQRAKTNDAWRDCGDCALNTDQPSTPECLRCFDDPARPNWTPDPINDAEKGLRALAGQNADAGIPDDGGEK